MAETKKQDEVDPRHRMAQRYMQAARDELAAKEADQPKAQRQRQARTEGPRAEGQPTLADFKPSISGSTFIHGLMLMFVLTGAALGLVLCYSLLNTVFVAGRVIALPVGVLIFLGLSYASALYLGIIESTSHGHTTPDDALEGDWRDWFWTMPASWGILAVTAGLGWAISRVAPSATWPIIGGTVWLLYPVLQLSTFETGSPTSLLSLPILSTLATRPLIWMSHFGLSFFLASTVAWLGQATWRDPPYVTMLWMGPIGAIAILIYAWLLGQLARWFAIGGR